MCRTFALLFLLCLSLPSLAGPSRLLDQRAPGSKSRKFVMFCARDTGSGSVGHAFVLFGDAPQGDEAGPIVITRGAGFYPSPSAPDDTLSLLRGVPGAVLNDYLDGPIKPDQCRLAVRIEEAVYNAQVAFVDGYSSVNYRLPSSTCVTMVSRIAANLKLTVPSLGGLEKLPAVFTRKLAEQNGTETDLNHPRPIQIP